MGVHRLSWLVHSLLLVLCIDIGFAFELQPIDLLQAEPGQKAARDNHDYSRLDLLSYETFLWGGAVNGRYALGNFTVFMPGKAENIISLEKVYPMLTSTECTRDSMTLNFIDEKSYRYGYEAWKWVNEAKHRTFLLVAGKGHCGWNTDRLPFVVNNVLFNHATKTIKAVGQVSEWKTVAHSYELTVGGRPGHAGRKRDYDEVYTLGVGFDLPLSHIQIGDGDLKFTYDCSGCGTKGDFEFDFHIKTWAFVPEDASLILTPHGVEAVFTPRLGLSANLGGKLTKMWDLGEIPIDGVSIAGGILDLGPKIVFQGGYTIGPLKGSAGMTFGGSVSLSDSAELSIDLLSPDISASGWAPQFSSQPLTVDAAISGSVQVNLDANIEVALDALDLGFEVGLVLQPFGGATLSLSASTGNACPNDPGAHEALKLSPSVGVNLIGQAAEESNTQSPFLKATLLSATYPLPTFCTGFNSGPSVPASNVSSQKPTAPPSMSSPSPIPMTSAPASSFPAPLTSVPPSSFLPPPSSSPMPTSVPVPSSSNTVPRSSVPGPSSGPVPPSSAPVPPSSVPGPSSGPAPSLSNPVPPSSVPGPSSGPVPPSSAPGTQSSAPAPPPTSAPPAPPPSSARPPPPPPPPTSAPPPPPPPPPPPHPSSSTAPYVRRRWARAPAPRIRP